MNEKKTETVRPEDMRTIAGAVAALMGDSDSRKKEDVDIATDVIHRIVEEWTPDGDVPGGAGHPNHRCRPCRNPPALAERPTWRPRHSLTRTSGRWYSHREVTPVESVSLKANGMHRYIYQEAEFVLEHVSESVVRVTHRDQTGYFGIHRDWEDDLNPYTPMQRDEKVHDDGIGGIDSISVNLPTPDEAIASLCTVMLDDRVEEDARLTRSGRWQESARSTLQELLGGLPG